MVSDTEARQLFCTNIYDNFSVLAPAGVGKTHAIVERICNILKQSYNYPHLYVITYTKKAAESLRQRVLRNTGQVPKNVFFGTIHSLCFRTIQRFKEALKLPEDLEVTDHLQNLRIDFLRHVLNPNDLPFWNEVKPFISLEQLLNLSEQLPHYHLKQPCKLDIPKNFINNILLYPEEKRNAKAIQAYKNKLQWWAEYCVHQGHYAPFPVCSTGGQAFKDTVNASFAVLQKHLEDILLATLGELGKLFYEYRLQKGQLKHNDIILAALQCLQIPSVIETIQQHPVAIILDEAQDTDVLQFDFLQALLQLNPKSLFSMVGDPQQSIYGQRANLAYYQKIHDNLINAHKGQELIFSKTFRCPQNVVSFLNKVFPQILSKQIDSSQVNYVPLSCAKPQHEGKICRVKIPHPESQDFDPVLYECQQLLNLLEKFQQKPSDVCLLCPRNDWLQEIQNHFKQSNLHLQLFTSRKTWREEPLYALLNSFIHLMAYPDDTYEISGLLLSLAKETTDHLYNFIHENDPSNLQILNKTKKTDSISLFLNQLTDLRQQCLQKSFLEAIQVILSHPILNVECLERNIVRNRIYQEAILQSSQDCSWYSLDLRLQKLLNTPIDILQEPLEDQWQGYSYHKSKGLEWPIVILPFFFRPLYPKNPSYPYWNYTLEKIAFSKTSKNVQEAQYLQREQQRLLYVACTRAKEQLIFIDDRNLWPTHNSIGNLLSCCPENIMHFEQDLHKL